MSIRYRRVHPHCIAGGDPWRAELLPVLPRRLIVLRRLSGEIAPIGATSGTCPSPRDGRGPIGADAQFVGDSLPRHVARRAPGPGSESRGICSPRAPKSMSGFSLA